MKFDPLSVYRTAVERVPAYRRFLERELGAVRDIQSVEEFAQLPLTDKHGYICQYPLPELCLDGTLAGKHAIVKSSGSFDKPVYWPQLPEQERGFERWVLDDLDALLGIRKEPALAIVTLPLGSLIAGELVTWTLRNAAIEHRCITLLTPGAQLDEAAMILERFSPYFAQTILFGYPPFTKAVLEAAHRASVPLAERRVSLRLAGDGYTESYRDQVMQLIGAPERRSWHIWSSYSSTDFGRVGRETPLCVAIRRLLHQSGKAAAVLGSAVLPSLMQYNPQSFHLEAIEDELVITRHQAVPLVRYRTGDRARLLSYSELMARLADAGLDPLGYLKEHGLPDGLCPQLPFLLVDGRADGGLKLFGVEAYANITLEQVRESIDSHPLLRAQLTGNFQLERIGEDTAQALVVHAEVRTDAAGVELPAIARALASELALRNKEFASLLSRDGDDALPRINPLQQGALLKDAKLRYIRRAPAT